MKKTYILFIFALILAGCGGGGSGGSGDRDYRITPGSLTEFDSPSGPGGDTDFSVNYGGVSTGNYAVIFNRTINGTDYVCIAVSDTSDPATETFNMKIYFPGSSIPVNKAISPAGNNFIVIYSGGEHRGLTGATLNLTFASSENNGYTIYNITSTDSINVDGTTLSALDINAVLVGSGS